MKNVTKTLKKITAIAVAAAMMTGLSACGGSSNSTAASGSSAEAPVKVRAALSDFVVALDKELHIYEKYGIDIEASQFAMGIESINALTTGGLEFAVGADYAIVNRLGTITGDTDLRIVAQITDYAPLVFFTDPETIPTTADLNGKRLATTVGTIFDYAYARMFEAYGADPDTITLVPVSTPAEALALVDRGELDGFWVYGKDEAKFAEHGWKRLVSTDEFGMGRYQFFLARQDYVNEHKDTVEAFLKATDEIYSTYYADQDAAAEIIARNSSLDTTNLKRDNDLLNYHITFDKEAFDKTSELNGWLRDNGYYEKVFDLADCVDASAVKEAFPDRVTYEK